MRPIHAYSIAGGPECGATGQVKLSMTGALITCPECLRIRRRPTREEALRSIEEAAMKWRDSNASWPK